MGVGKGDSRVGAKGDMGEKGMSCADGIRGAPTADWLVRIPADVTEAAKCKGTTPPGPSAPPRRCVCSCKTSLPPTGQRV
jgi:hypothetical protein